MSLAPGTRLGAYEVLALIGAGGMGEVYRARDTRLQRDVAIKVLPDLFANDHERMARFQREAQVLASLNHPHIGGIYGLEETDSVKALVLELVEGSTLADRIAQGPMPLDEALPIARQIAEALEAAHEQGIIHRDLKPANIKLRPDGTVKVLDFGLAKALDPASSLPAAVLSNSPTITTPAATRMGVILGTAAYMSPEQAKGKPVDKRADIWAFGCVLYEMLTGKRAFEGDDVSDTIASVLAREPDWAALPVALPTAIRAIVQRCLEKDRKQRMADISIAHFLLTEPASLTSVHADIAARPAGPALGYGWRRGLPWAVAVAALAFGSLALWARWRTMPPPSPLRLSADLGADASLVTDLGPATILSPDGSMLAFVARQDAEGKPQLYVRRLEQLQATPLSGTENARTPFFSPDGRWIAFFADDKLKKISVTGGAAVTLCNAPGNRGGAWGEDGTIVFHGHVDLTSPERLMRVSSAGGQVEPLTTLGEGENRQTWPQVLPGAKAVLYTGTMSATTDDDANLVVLQLPSGAKKVVQRGGYYGRYLPSGHLVYIHQGTLFAAPFDLDRLEVTGQPVPALEGVTANPNNGGAQFAASDTGTLMYLSGQNVGSDAPIHWMDRTGKTTPLRAAPSNWSNPRFAPDGRQLAVDISDGRQTDVWVYDWARETLSRLTFDPADDLSPVWTPDGRRIAFTSGRSDKSMNLYWQRADGTGEVQRLTESKNNQLSDSWHPSGKFLAFSEQNPQTKRDLMILPMEGDETSGWKPGKPTVFLNSPFDEIEGMFSPDGRWLAYLSNESGRPEMYVRPFPGPGGKWQISTGGADDPHWSRNRHELFYSARDDRIMVVPYSADGDSFRAEKPRLWSEERFAGRPRPPSFDWDLHPDGERIALAPLPQVGTTTKQNKVVLIFNFYDELRRIAPVAKR